MKQPMTDRRTRRTYQALRHALVDLMERKNYDAITVQELLDQADVGRSTFYNHFYDKDDLLFKSLSDMFDHLYSDAPDDHLFPSHAIFQHIEQHQALYKNLARSQRFEAVLKTVQTTLINQINQRLADYKHTNPVMQAMIAPYLAGSFISILRWWLDQALTYSVSDIDAAFQQLAVNHVGQLIGEVC